MSDKKLKDTFHGKHYKYEIYEQGSTFGSPKYYLYRDGKPHGTFSSLAAAVEAAKKEG